ncbi:hypothetical protein [Vibrio hippocampi]|uniref:DUF2845 domain-containing protein n=1 Tax=Vibrio hippocampi TaxID=654686 RepID=A0ABN8DLU5_9VIBR|nr:hypothetical protein [Vibrio hippocampi]CAH0529195.1 hypothetical protein VHP8226_03098 [Vibrio hippocampi]
MKKAIILLTTLVISTGAAAGAKVTIPKDRVICQTETGMKTFLARKATNRLKKGLPSECRSIDRKRIGEVKVRYKGYVRVKTMLGDNVFVDKDAIRYN